MPLISSHLMTNLYLSRFEITGDSILGGFASIGFAPKRNSKFLVKARIPKLDAGFIVLSSCLRVGPFGLLAATHVTMLWEQKGYMSFVNTLD